MIDTPSHDRQTDFSGGFSFLPDNLFDRFAPIKQRSDCPRALLSPCPGVAPKRVDARKRMFFAVFSSLSAMYPQLGQLWVRTESDFLTVSPQLEHFCDVYCGGGKDTIRAKLIVA